MIISLVSFPDGIFSLSISIEEKEQEDVETSIGNFEKSLSKLFI